MTTNIMLNILIIMTLNSIVDDYFKALPYNDEYCAKNNQNKKRLKELRILSKGKSAIPYLIDNISAKDTCIIDYYNGDMGVMSILPFYHYTGEKAIIMIESILSLDSIQEIRANNELLYAENDTNKYYNICNSIYQCYYENTYLYNCINGIGNCDDTTVIKGCNNGIVDSLPYLPSEYNKAFRVLVDINKSKYRYNNTKKISSEHIDTLRNIYSSWWECNKYKTINTIREAYQNGETPLSGTIYILRYHNKYYKP